MQAHAPLGLNRDAPLGLKAAAPRVETGCAPGGEVLCAPGGEISGGLKSFAPLTVFWYGNDHVSEPSPVLIGHGERALPDPSDK